MTSLLSYLEEKVFLLWNESADDGYSLGLETNLLNTQGPQEDIVAFLELFEALPDELMQQLMSCTSKIFDIGFDGGEQGLSMDAVLEPSVIARVARFGFGISVRIYAGSVGDMKGTIP